MANYTWAQIEDFAGTPIIIFTFWNPNTKKLVEITIESLPPAAQTAVLQFINNHLP